MATRSTRTARAPKAHQTLANVLGIPMPQSLPAQMEPEFHALIDRLNERDGVVKSEDLSLVEAYLNIVSMLREAYRSIAEDGQIVDDGKRSNPALNQVALMTGALTKIGATLGIGPAHRQKLKLPAGKAGASPWADALKG